MRAAPGSRYPASSIFRETHHTGGLFVSRSRFVAVCAAALTLLIGGAHSREAFSQAGSTEITILSSGYEIGELAPCG